MATKTVTVRTCDFLKRNKVCGESAEPPGLAATIGTEKMKGDLCADHQVALSDELAKLGMASVGMRTSGRKVTKGYRSASGKKFSTTEARAWAVAEGHFDKSRKGRLPKDVLDQYAAAH